MFESVFTFVAKLRGGARGDDDGSTDRVPRREPGDAEDRMALARELSTAGEPMRAAHHYSAVLEADPTNATAHREYAALLAAQSYHESAARHYERALELTGDETVRDEYSDLLLEKGEDHKLETAVAAD